MANENREGVYGENQGRGSIQEESEIRKQSVEKGSDKSVAEDMDEIRDGQAEEAGHGGMGREGTPRNSGESQGEFTPVEDKPNTPG